ncbi:hypothetical protein PQR64_35800 [Paraburkholderia phytofirmans]|uniref:hypothetical protein n=1 Tax=Paraburkholderia phytofirmans TaxID=261302 RepID=UPI0038B6F0D7
MDEQKIRQVVALFAVEAVEILTPPRAPTFMAALEFECGRASAAVIGHEPDADGMALAQHVMLVLRIDGDIRLGIRTAFMQFASRILDDRLEEAAADLRNALMGRVPHGRD